MGDRSFVIFPPCLLLAIWFCMFKCVAAKDTSSDAQARVIEIVSQLDRLVFDVRAGSMDFKISEHRPQLAAKGELDFFQKYEGRISWSFPNIRWEFEEWTEGATVTPRAKKIIIDSEAGIFTHNVSSKIVFKCPDKSRSYENSLKLAPWQCWLALNGKHAIKDFLLDVVENPKGREYELRDRFQSTLLQVTSIGDGCKAVLSVDFDSKTGRPIKYETKSSCLGDAKFDGEIGWVTVDGKSFPGTIKYFSWASGNRPSQPLVVVDFSHHTVASVSKSTAFEFESLDLSEVDKVITYRLGHQPIIQTLGPKEDENEIVRRLGQEAKTSGFAAPSK